MKRRDNMDKNRAEKSPFANACQVGVIVRDMDEAVEYYQSLGIGPFRSSTTAHLVTDRKVYGKPADDVKNTARLAQIMGQLDLELVQPVSGESIQKEFLETRGEGINHLGFLVDDIEKETAKLVEKGFKVKVTVFFKGRNIMFKDRGELLLAKLANELEDLAIPEEMPKMQSRNKMGFTLKPKKTK